MNFMFNLSEYETVDSRIHQFYGNYPHGRIVTEMELIDMEKGHVVFKAYIYKDEIRTMPDATGYADGFRKDRGVDAQFWINNAETSSIGRALANLGLSAKGKRPSAEEMAQVNAVKTVAPKPVKPSVQDLDTAIRAADKEPAEQDYWTTPVNDYMKVVDAPVTLEKAMENITAVMGTPEASEVPQCKHGSMVWKTGHSAKTGKDWASYQCTALGHSGFEGKCPTVWYELNSAGKWQPQKARV
jgi:hypothetical protein